MIMIGINHCYVFALSFTYLYKVYLILIYLIYSMQVYTWGPGGVQCKLAAYIDMFFRCCLYICYLTDTRNTGNDVTSADKLDRDIL